MRQVHATRTCGVVNAIGVQWAIWGLAALVPPALAAPPAPFTDPNSGIEMVRIGAVDNPSYNGPDPLSLAAGRGSVSYEYSIGQLEVTSGQWVEFFNAAYDRPANDRLPHLLPPTFWGGIPTTPTVAGGLRWTTTPQSAMLPTGNISWRMAAMYCNWLHNDKQTNREAFLNGAYDVSTFGFTPGGYFTDQLTHNPDARYWIPTWDEWMKAAHYDPDKPNGDGTIGGWWLYSNSSDVQPVPGPPGAIVMGMPAQANYAWDSSDFPGQSPFAIPLGAYPDVTTPWGLLDAAGATGEWTEESVYAVLTDPFPHDRWWEGSSWTFGSLSDDQAWSPGGGEFPSYSAYDAGIRIASSVIPSPGSGVAVGLFALHFLRRRRS